MWSKYVTMYWLRWHYHVKDIAGAPYKIKKKSKQNNGIADSQWSRADNSYTVQYNHDRLETWHSGSRWVEYCIGNGISLWNTCDIDSSVPDVYVWIADDEVTAHNWFYGKHWCWCMSSRPRCCIPWWHTNTTDGCPTAIPQLTYPCGFCWRVLHTGVLRYKLLLDGRKWARIVQCRI